MKALPFRNDPWSRILYVAALAAWSLVTAYCIRHFSIRPRSIAGTAVATAIAGVVAWSAVRSRVAMFGMLIVSVLGLTGLGYELSLRMTGQDSLGSTVGVWVICGCIVLQIALTGRLVAKWDLNEFR